MPGGNGLGRGVWSVVRDYSGIAGVCLDSVMGRDVVWLDVRKSRVYGVVRGCKLLGWGVVSSLGCGWGCSGRSWVWLGTVMGRLGEWWWAIMGRAEV